MRWIFPLLLTVVAAGCAKDPHREWQCRLAVRKLAKAERQVDKALDRVVAYGDYALAEIEQELHTSPAAGRLRLIRALERIASRESIPLLRFLSHWDTDKEVRKQARLLSASLKRRK